jgi:hypothetical protein
MREIQEIVHTWVYRVVKEEVVTIDIRESEVLLDLALQS